MQIKKIFLSFLGFYLFFGLKPVLAGELVKINEPTGAIPNLGQLISSGVTAIIIVAGLLTFLYLVYGGIEWLTSGGDKTKMEEARGKITSAIIGLAIVAAAWAIMKLVGHFFGINITDFQIPNALNQTQPAAIPGTYQIPKAS